LTLLPEAYALHQSLAQAQSRRGATAEAIKSYESALRLNPKATDADRRAFGAARTACGMLNKEC
jgi:Tfp pilus assembly protein PilF